MKSRITRLARPNVPPPVSFAAALACNRCGSPRPIVPRAPTCSASRRDSPSQKRTPELSARRFSIGRTREGRNRGVTDYSIDQLERDVGIQAQSALSRRQEPELKASIKNSLQMPENFDDLRSAVLRS